MANYDKWLQDVVEAAEEVLRNLPPVEFKEEAYEEALCHEMRIRGIPYERQRNFELLYKGYKIGTGRVDFIINPYWATKKEENVLEIKSVKKIEKKHIKQAKVYMNSLGIKKGAVMSFHYEVGVQVEPLELSTVKPISWSVVKPKVKKIEKIKPFLEYALNEVYQYFGSEFIYRESTNIESYKKAMGVEFRLNGIDFKSVSFPVMYKNQTVYEDKIDFVFEDNTALVLSIYENQENIDTDRAIYDYYAQLIGIKKMYLGMIPKKETENAFLIEVR